MRLNVLYQFNEKYAPYAGISMVSLMENNKIIDEITIYVMGENLTLQSQKNLRDKCSNITVRFILLIRMN